MDGLSSLQWQEGSKRLDCDLVYAPRKTDITHLNVYFVFNEVGELKEVYATWQKRASF